MIDLRDRKICFRCSAVLEKQNIIHVIVYICTRYIIDPILDVG